MSELNTPDSGTVEVSIPEDFSAYENFRRTGELPAVEPSEVQTEESETGTVSDSETDNDQESAEDESKPERDENGQFRKKQRGIDKRFHELTSEIRGLKEQLASRADTSVASSAVQEQKAPAGEPQPEQYDDYNQYIRDLAKWTIKSESEAAERAESNRRQQVAAQTAAEQWQAREKALKAKHSDYEDAIQSFKIPETPAVAEVRDFLGESEKGPELLYFLAKNPAEAERIVKLSPDGLSPKWASSRTSSLHNRKQPRP